MNILIVDDEFYLVQGLKKAIDWEKLGITGVYEAYSADQAKKVYEEHEVDILISDVEMPKENGLSLIKWVKENGYESINILLTGHANFDYAREGINLSILDYVLKPVDGPSLTPVIEKAVAKVTAMLTSKEKEQDQALTELWALLYRGNMSSDPDTIAEYLEDRKLSVTYENDNYFYAYLQVKTESFSLSSADITHILAEGIKREVFFTEIGNNCYMIAVRIPKEIDGSIDIEKEMYDFFTASLNRLTDAKPEARYLIYTFACAPISAAPYALELLQQYSRSILATDSRMIPIFNSAVEDATRQSKKNSQNLPLEKWEDMLSQRHARDILLDIRGLLMQTDSTYSSAFLHSIYYGLLSVTFSVLTQNGYSPMQISQETGRAVNPMEITSSRDGLLKWAESLLRGADALLESNAGEDSVVEQVKLYIKNNLSDPELGRATIAEAVHISPDYLSFIFHKEEGEVLSSYITTLRINAAKKLLLGSGASSNEIAEKTGFSNVSYFHKQFKKITGFTPNAYRAKYKI